MATATSYSLLIVLLLALCCSVTSTSAFRDVVSEHSVDDTLVINAKTDLIKLFECSRQRPVGAFNEYYVACALRQTVTTPSLRRVVLQDVQIHGSQLYADASENVHVELALSLNATIDANTSIELSKSAIHASAVTLEATAIAMGASSVVNASASGLKFGPGYNSWFNMGSSYGGLGGAAFGMLLHRKCENMAPLNFYRAIGSVDGDLGNFQGYGSGGGGVTTRGGGRIEIRATKLLVFNGSLLANGGPADTQSSDSAGSGGTVLVTAGHIAGSGTMQANGGDPAAYDDASDSGGGGGGGGGRVVLRYSKLDELNATQLQAYGGGILPDKRGATNSTSTGPTIQWCQLGGDGSILKVLLTGNEDDDNTEEVERSTFTVSSLVGNLVVKGRRVGRGVPSKPIAIYGCTPLFYETSRGDRFVPEYVAQLFVVGGASLCTSYFVLQPNVSTTNSSIVIESGSSVHVLDHNRSVTLGATHVSLQSYIGPVSQSIRDAFTLTVTGGEIALANAQVLADQVVLSAVSNVVIDKYSVVKFQRRVALSSETGDVQVLGILEPSTEDRGLVDIRMRDDPVISVAANQNVVFTPQGAQVGALRLELHAGQDATIDMPFETPFLTLFAEATNLVIVRVTGGAIRECKSIESLASATTCKDVGSIQRSTATASHSPFLLNFKATETLTLGNVTGGSILACCDGVLSVEGRLTTDARGCSANTGPGTSSIASGASGGAGHGGKGGNVEPGNTGGGKAYDFPSSELWPYSLSHDELSAWPVWPGSGAAAGDGSGDIAGGSGGGVVYVGARQLSFSNPLAAITARGGVGSKSGGGGAGGAVMLSLGELLGSGSVDVTGGDSLATTTAVLRLETKGADTKSSVWEPLWSVHEQEEAKAQNNDKAGGGGGAGGIIRTFFRGDEPGASGNGDDFAKHGGKLVMSGGKGLGGEDGGVGILAAVNCSMGRGGGLCQQCEPGSFSPDRESKCLPCEPGSFSDHAGLGSCPKCAAGSCNPDFGKQHCDACAPGSFAKSDGAKACVPCAPGSFADKPGESACLLCPLGTISITAGTVNCTLCGIGETTPKPGALHCEQCTNKPEHSSFNVRGKCTYACEKGRTGLDCLTPFERFVKPIGGPLGFAILVGSLVVVVFGSWGFITYRTNADQKFRKRFAQYRAQTLRDQRSLTNLTKNLTPRLTDHDLVGHVTRLYFSGANHLFSSWVLDPFGMPTELRELVRDDEAFATFALSCNELVAWPASTNSYGIGWECWVHRLLMVLVPPCATLFLRKRQLYRVEKLAKHVTQYTGGFVRELGFRRHGAQLKVGFSPDFSLAYFDVIAPTSALATATSALSTPTSSSSSLLLPSPQTRGRLPDASASSSSSSSAVMTSLIIAVAGSGSFFRPHYLDTNDVLVRAVPARLELLQHQFWIDFIAEMNQRLRLVEQPTASASRLARTARALTEILAFVSKFNQQRRLRNDGVRVDFGTLKSTSLFEALAEDDIGARLESYAMEPFKFALLVTKTPATAPSGAAAGAGGDGVESAAAPPLSQRETTSPDTLSHSDDDPRPIEFRYSSIRMEALFDRPRQHSREDDNGGDEALEPLFGSSPKRWRRNSRDVAASISELIVCSPRSAPLYWLTLALQPVAPLFRLRNLRVRALPMAMAMAMPLVMLLLLLADWVVVFWILMEFYCVQVDDPTAHDSGCSRVAFVSVLSVLPLALTGAPVLGLVFLARKSVFYGKLFAVWTLGSLVNLVVALLCCGVYFNYVRESVLVVVAAGLLTKLLEKEAALWCIAQYTVERPLRGWRGLHTTKDWYDAAYTPLIHHER